MATLESLREEAARARRLALFCTDKIVERDLLAYAVELDARDLRMTVAIENNSAADPRAGGSKAAD